MATITIRNIDDRLKSRLKIRAAMRGKSMEEEARDILRDALSTEASGAGNLAQAIRKRLVPLGGVDLNTPPREANREPQDFEA